LHVAVLVYTIVNITRVGPARSAQSHTPERPGLSTTETEHTDDTLVLELDLPEENKVTGSRVKTVRPIKYRRWSNTSARVSALL
jgi:hypothetical protein